MAEWRHGLIIVLPGSLADALASTSKCGSEPEPYQRLCLEEAAVDLLASVLEERSPAWRADALRANALLEMASRYLHWILAGSPGEDYSWELLRRAYNSAAAAYFAARGRLAGSKQLRKALEDAKRALESRRGLMDAARALGNAVRAAGVEEHPPPPRAGAYAPAALALPP